jgi:hypothetical protein
MVLIAALFGLLGIGLSHSVLYALLARIFFKKWQLINAAIVEVHKIRETENGVQKGFYYRATYEYFHGLKSFRFFTQKEPSILGPNFSETLRVYYWRRFPKIKHVPELADSPRSLVIQAFLCCICAAVTLALLINYW